MMGAPPQMDLLDYKPKMRDWYDKDLPESIRQGQRLTTMTSGQARFPIAPSVFEFSTARAERRLDLGAAAPHGADGGRHRHHPLHAHRGHQPRAGHHLHPDRPADTGTPLHRGVVRLRPREHEPRPADLRGDERREESSQGGRAGDFGQAVELRVPVAGVRRGRAAGRRRSGALPARSRTACRGTVRRQMLDGLAS